MSQIKIKQPVYIAPFSSIGVITYHVLRQAGVEVAAFCDGSPALFRKEYDGCPIVPPEQAYTQNPDATVVVASARYEKPVWKQLEKMGFTNIIPAHQLLTRENTAGIAECMARVPTNGLPAISVAADAVEENLNGYLLPKAARGENALVLTQLELAVTERCTLRCRDCADMMQYYERPQDMDLGALAADFALALAAVDFVRTVNILGGEPLMHKGLAGFLRQVWAGGRYGAKVGKTTLTTNGTLPPDEALLSALKETGIVVHLSDYGLVSRRANELEALLGQNGIPCVRSRDMQWMDCTKIVDGESRTPQQGQAEFEACEMTCCTIKQGVFYRCPFAAHGASLGAFPAYRCNGVELDDPRLRERLQSYMAAKNAIPACRFCSGYQGTRPAIAPAVQAKQPLVYKKYGRT